MEESIPEVGTKTESTKPWDLEKTRRQNAEREVLAGLAASVKRLATSGVGNIKKAEPVLLEMISAFEGVDINYTSKSWLTFKNKYVDELEKVFGIGFKYGEAGKHSFNATLSEFIPFGVGPLREFARILREEGRVSVDALFGDYGGNSLASPYDGAVRTALEFLELKPDMVLIAPNAAFLPAVMARDALRHPEVKGEMRGDYKEPYFLYPKTKSYKYFREIYEFVSSGDWRDFDLLVDEYGSPEAIPASVESVPKRTPHRSSITDDQSRVRVSNPTEGARILREIFRDMERIANAIAVNLPKDSDEQISLLIYDEAVYQGKTVSDLNMMVQGALKILTRKGVIPTRDKVRVLTPRYAFGNKRIRGTTKIKLVGSNERASSKNNKSGFKYAEAVSDVLAGAVVSILREGVKPTEEEYNDTSGGGGFE